MLFCFHLKIISFRIYNFFWEGGGGKEGETPSKKIKTKLLFRFMLKKRTLRDHCLGLGL